MPPQKQKQKQKQPETQGKPQLSVSKQKLLVVLNDIYDTLVILGDNIKASAYKRAVVALSGDAVASETDMIVVKDLMSVKGIGKSIYSKIVEFAETGTISYLEELKQAPQLVFSQVYGIGPKMAKKLVEEHKLTTIADLKANLSLFNDKQKLGIKYYDDIIKRIPRSEIQHFDNVLRTSIPKQLVYEIVGSYRRGAADSGDIDVIISLNLEFLNDSDNEGLFKNKSVEQISNYFQNVFKQYLEYLHKQEVITEFLSLGNKKSLVIGKVPSYKTYRRIDFLYTPPEEYGFAVIYFTGSKDFNTAMRGYCLTLGLSLNEHGFTRVATKKMVDASQLTDEKKIFEYLNIEYVEPNKRIDGNALRVIGSGEGAVGDAVLW